MNYSGKVIKPKPAVAIDYFTNLQVSTTVPYDITIVINPNYHHK
jgi:hypothetical protein